MVPWPIVLLCAAYTMLATSSAATVWRAFQQSGGGYDLHQSLWWPVFWGALSSMLVIGLAWLKPWARRLAVWTSVLMMLGAMGVAGIALAKASPQPMRSLMATGMAGVQLVAIRYLTRPHVKAWFGTA